MGGRTGNSLLWVQYLLRFRINDSFDVPLIEPNHPCPAGSWAGLVVYLFRFWCQHEEEEPSLLISRPINLLIKFVTHRAQNRNSLNYCRAQRPRITIGHRSGVVTVTVLSLFRNALHLGLVLNHKLCMQRGINERPPSSTVHWEMMSIARFYYVEQRPPYVAVGG